MNKTTLAVLDSAIVQDQFNKNKIIVNFDMIECDSNGCPPDHYSYNHHQQHCLRIISRSGYEDIAYHDVVRLLLYYKWQNFGKYLFFLRASLHLATMIAIIIAFVLAGRSTNPATYGANAADIIRGLCEIIYMFVVLYKIMIELYQIYKDRYKYFHWYNLKNYSDQIFIISSILAMVLRFSAAKLGNVELLRGQYILLSFAFFTYIMKSYKLLMISKKTGALLEICRRILLSDVLPFTLIFGIFLLASSGALYLALRSESLTLKAFADDFFMTCPVHSNTTSAPQCAALSYLIGEFHYVLITGFRVLLDAQSIFKFFAPCDNCGFGVLSTIYYFAFQFGVVAVLLNLLIAQMSDTYEKVFSDVTRKFYSNRALLLSRMEHHSILKMLPRRLCNIKLYKESKSFSKQKMNTILNKQTGNESSENKAIMDTQKAVKECYDAISEMKYILQHQQIFLERALMGSFQNTTERCVLPVLPRLIRHHDTIILTGDTSLVTIEIICQGLKEIRKYLYENKSESKIEGKDENVTVIHIGNIVSDVNIGDNDYHQSSAADGQPIVCPVMANEESSANSNDDIVFENSNI